jgi:adenylylsulfate kinase
LIQRSDKEKLLKQKGVVIWLTGLSGAGKTTIANALERELHNSGLISQILDGDVVRAGINNNLDFSNTDRIENIRRVSEVAKLFVNSGIITICCFVSPTEEIRNLAKKIIGKQDFKEVFVNTSLKICEQRDVKGLYAKARKGELKDFTGIDAPYEVPLAPDLELRTGELNIEDSVKKIIEIIPTNN